jgi:hypothetical protein
MVRIKIFWWGSLLTRCAQAVQVRHADIQNDDVGLQPLSLVHGFPTIGCFSTHFPPGMGFQQGAEAAAHDFMIVSNQYTKR